MSPWHSNLGSSSSVVSQYAPATLIFCLLLEYAYLIPAWVRKGLESWRLRVFREGGHVPAVPRVIEGVSMLVKRLTG